MNNVFIRENTNFGIMKFSSGECNKISGKSVKNFQLLKTHRKENMLEIEQREEIKRKR